MFNSLSPDQWASQEKFSEQVYLGMQDISARSGLFGQGEAEDQLASLEKYQQESEEDAAVSSLCQNRQLEGARTKAALSNGMQAVSSVLNSSFGLITSIGVASGFKQGYLALVFVRLWFSTNPLFNLSSQ